MSDPKPVLSGSDSFDRAIRTMARRKGHEVAEDAKIIVQMTGRWSGYSEYTITNQWEEFMITIEGVKEQFVYDSDEENRASFNSDIDYSPRAALAKLWDDLQ